MGNCASQASSAKEPADSTHCVSRLIDRLLVVETQPSTAKPVLTSTEQPDAKACGEPASVEEIIEIASPGEIPNAVVNPDTDLILNILDPVNGPASGLPFQVHYLGPPRPPCEKQRLATVMALDKIQKPQEDPEISSILNLVATVFKAPAVLCALFDEKQVWVSEQAGNVIPCGEFPWRWTLCGWSMAFKNPQILVIQDTLQDVRFSNNYKVCVSPGVRFYCGAPLVASNGHRLGTLCFADVKPRKFDMASCLLMNNFSELVVRQLEKDITIKLKEKTNKELATTYSHLQRTLDCFDNCVVLLDVSEPGWRIMYVNAAWQRFTGKERESLVGKLLHDILEATDGSPIPSKQQLTATAKLQPFNVQIARMRDPTFTKTFSVTFKPAGKSPLDDGVMSIGVPSFLSLDQGDDQVAKKFYFMTMKPTGSPNTNCTNSSSPSNILSLNSSSMGSNSSGSNVIEGLELAHLLGRGSFGSVFYATYFGTPTAVKIIDEDLIKPVSVGGPMAATGSPNTEALLALKLRHPHIVSTLKYTVRAVPRSLATPHNTIRSLELQEESCLDGMESNTLNGSTTSVVGSATGPGTGLASAPAVAGWAVIQVPTDDEAVPVDDDEIGSEETLAMLHDCQVQAGGWGCMVSGNNAQSTEANVKGSGARHAAAGKSSASESAVSNLDSSHSGPNSTTATSTVMHQTWMVMEFCDKGCVQDAVDRGWLRDSRDAQTSKPNMVAILATALEIASAMQYLHAQDIVHGDLSGWNVMLSSGGSSAKEGGRGFVAKVADFGLSRALEARTRITTRNYGTITHMPPELLTDGLLTKATDVYSFGVLMWQMYTGSRPWSGMRHAQIMVKLIQERVQLQWSSDAPPAYKALAQRCMAYSMDDRPTFGEVVIELDTQYEEVDGGPGVGEL
mmetsp:Transcript_19044/g.32598  ORF Transcript_19044/g.32598 Transcript_19044/m.32598 type:complete len:905 (+) Transcript_19044:39-2753(+)